MRTIYLREITLEDVLMYIEPTDVEIAQDILEAMLDNYESLMMLRQMGEAPWWDFND